MKDPKRSGVASESYTEFLFPAITPAVGLTIVEVFPLLETTGVQGKDIY